MKVFLDSSFIISFTLENDENHKAAEKLIEEKRYGNKNVIYQII